LPVVAVTLIATGWVLLAAAGRPARPWPPVQLLVGIGLAYAGAHVIASRRVWFVPAVIASGVAVLFLASPGFTSGHPLAEPLGYGNANAALLVQGAVAAAMCLLIAHHLLVRAAAAVAMLGLVAATVPTKSSAGMLLAVVVLVAALLAIRVAPVRTVVAGSVTAVALVSLATMALGVSYAGRDGGAVDRTVDQTLTARRPALWYDALRIVRDEPLRGVGPGAFAETSPVARSDADARWAHSLLLQHAAETGLPGVLLLLALVGLGFAALYRGTGPPAPRMLAVVGLAALLLHAAIDYVGHFPAVPLVTAALVGAAAASPPRARSPQP
jgi:O-antigen ligase